MSGDRRCALCHEWGNVRPGLDLTSEGAYLVVPRCVDHDACRQRFEAAAGARPELDEPGSPGDDYAAGSDVAAPGHAVQPHPHPMEEPR
jgi:hypothetical protein